MLIGISGKKRHGKDTVVDIIQEMAKKQAGQTEKDSPVFKKVAFASLLNDINRTITGTDYSSLSAEKKEQVRPTIIKLATAMKEVYGKHVFVSHVMEEIAKDYFDKGQSNHIISDVRLQIEANALKSMSDPSMILRVIRYQEGDRILFDDGVEIKSYTIKVCRQHSCLISSVSGDKREVPYERIQHPSIGHETETELDFYDFDAVIYNIGDGYGWLEQEIEVKVGHLIKEASNYVSQNKSQVI
jgi:hypothetical protein